MYDKLFTYIASGEDLTTACKRKGMPTPWTVRRRLAVDDVLNDQYLKARSIHLHGLADEIDSLPDQALAKIAKPTGADLMAWSKQKADNRKWLVQKLLAEYQGFEDGGGHVTLNIVNAPDMPAAGAAPYVPPGQPLLKIVGGPKPVEGEADSDSSGATHG